MVRRARPVLCVAYALRPVTIAPSTRLGTHFETAAGKTSDCRDAIQPKIQIVNVIPTNTAVMFHRMLRSALPGPELVSVRRSRPRKSRLKLVSNRVREYCSSPRGCLMSQMTPRSADKPPSVVVALLKARVIPESRPISINLFSS
jgi:hypothetical protein